MANRKEKIKNITIVFLLVMLLLTFFSNTIMNYSLVEVSTQMVTSGSLTTKVRGSGTVEANESYSVTIEETRKVATVNVKENAEVAEGDVLFTLEDSDSDELDAAKKTLADAEAAYEAAVLAAGITVAERQAIEAGKGTSLTQKQNEISSANQAVEDAQAAVDAAQATVDKIQAQITALGNTAVDTSAEEKAVLDAEKKNTDAQAAVTAAQTTVSDIQSQIETYEAIQNSTTATDAEKADAAAKVTEYQQKLAGAQSTLAAANTAATDAQNALNTANYNLSVKKLSGSSTTEANSLQTQLNTATAALTDANTALASAQSAQTEVSTKINGEVSVASAYQTYAEAQEAVEKLTEKSIGTEITSPIAGTVTDIAVTAGTTVSADEVMMTIQPENKAYIIQFTVSESQAKRVKTGDVAEVVNNWYGNDVTATVTGVHRDSQDRTKSVIVCEIKGDVEVGDSYTLSIGAQTSNYDAIVPTSTIREDSNGKFILIIESKSTPLGNRYYARRVDIEVITSDDTQSAVSGALEGYEYVITTTTKPIEENDQVRLATE